jgi:hypothetical protein
MSRGIVNRFTGTLSLLLIMFIKGYSQDAAYRPVRFMFYNTENLFDTYKDEVTDDEEFLPGGVRRWNNTRYSNKLNSVFKTIMAAGEWDPPAFVGLCEVENRKVLEDLTGKTNLARFNYGIIHEDSPDERGIDVCLIYRKDKVIVISYRYMKPGVMQPEEFTTRTVLYLKLRISDDTIHVFLNHWPSRRGGVLASEDLRFTVAQMVKEKTDSIAAGRNGKIRIVMMGDFNCTPDDKVIGLITGNYSSGLSMVNITGSLPSGSGTYRYKGTWEMIDQVFVSDFLLKCNKGLYTEPGMCRIFKADFLLRDDPKYPGRSPFPTYVGYKYNGGYSDHLPVLLDIMVRKQVF